MNDSDPLPQYVEPNGRGRATGGLRWANRGTALSDSDGFNATYGARADAARIVVQRAVDDWRRVFYNLNQGNGESQLDITINGLGLGTGWGGSGGVTSVTGNKPRTSFINLGGGGDADGNGTVSDGEGFFIDPTPGEYSEFEGTITDAYVGQAQAGSPAVGLPDLYSLVTIEMQHALGMTSNSNLAWRNNAGNVIQDTGQTDGVDTPGKLYAFQSGSVTGLLTSNNGGPGGTDFNWPIHCVRNGQTAVWNGNTYTGFYDTGAAVYAPGTRFLPSGVSARMLQSVYGYSMANPESFGTFYGHLEGSGRLRVVGSPVVAGLGFPSDDFVSVSQFGAQISLRYHHGNEVAGNYPTADFVSYFDASSMSGGISIDLGDGNDTIDVSRFVDYPNLQITVVGNTGNDTLNATGVGSAPTTCEITTNSVTGGYTNITQIAGIEHLNIVGTTGPDNFLVTSTSSGMPLTISSADGDDTLSISANRSLFGSNVTFNGEGGIGDRVLMNHSQNLAASSYLYSAARLTWDNFTVNTLNTEKLEVHAGTGPDSFNIPAPSANWLAYGGFGNDMFTIGGGALGAASATTGLFGEGNSDTIRFDDHNTTLPCLWTVTAASVTRFQNAQQVFPYVDFEAVSVLCGNGVDNFNVTGFALFTKPLTIDLSGGDDQFHLAGAATFDRDGYNPPITLFAGTGRDTLYCDDQDAAPTQYSVSRNLFTKNDGGSGVDLSFSDAERFWINGSNYDDAIDIYQPSFPMDVWVVANGGNDTCRTFIDSAPAIGTSTYFFGGAGNDVYVVDASANPIGANFTLNNGVVSAGTGVLAANYSYDSVATLYVNGADLDTSADIFLVKSITTPTVLNGQAGDDRYTFDGTAIRGPNGLFQMATVNGGDGDDRAQWTDAGRTTGAAYVIGQTSFTISSGSSGVGFGSGLEQFTVDAGETFDTFNVYASPANTLLQLNGRGGGDTLDLGRAIDSVSAIHGSVAFDGGTGNNTATVWNPSDTAVGRVLHVLPGSVGAFPGDTFFPTGGSFSYSALQTLTILPGGRNVVCYAAPSPDARVYVNFLNTPGDQLHLALAAVVNPIRTNTTATAGNVTSDNLEPLYWTGADSSDTDDSVPVLVSADFALGAGRGGTGAGQALTALFSEDISPLLSVDALSLFNATTGIYVASSDIAVNYDLETNIAAFTFPNYADGLLPDGVYEAQLVDLSDAFGNPMTPSDLYTFAWSGGTEGDDSFRIALAPKNLGYAVYLNDDTTPMLLAGFGTSKIVLAGGLGADTFTVDLATELAGLTQGIDLIGGNDANGDTLIVRGAVAADNVTFDAGSVSVNGGQISEHSMEAIAYVDADDSTGGDTLAVNFGRVGIARSERFTSLAIADGAVLQLPDLGQAVLTVDELALSSGATLDLAGGGLIVHPGALGGEPLAAVRDLVLSGRNGGTWNGPGITSSATVYRANTGLGVASADELFGSFPAEFMGENAQSGDVLVRYTLDGDSNLNGAVEFADLLTLAQHYGQAGTYADGDFNYDGIVGFDDLLTLAQNYGGFLDLAPKAYARFSSRRTNGKLPSP